MPEASFPERFESARAEFGPLVVGLDPSPRLFESWGEEDTPEGLERFVDVALEAVVGAAGVAKPQSAFFERHGWKGIRALDRLVRSLRGAGVLVVLDVKRGDIGSTNAAYADAYLGAAAALPADAVTLSAYLGLEALGAFFEAAPATGCGFFVVVRSSNSEGRRLQRAVCDDGRTVEESMLAALAERNRTAAPAGIGPFGAVFAPNHGRPDAIDLREVGGLFLAPGLGAQGATEADLAACFEQCPERVLPSASRSLLAAGPETGRLRDAIAELAGSVRAALGP